MPITFTPTAASSTFTSPAAAVAAKTPAAAESHRVDGLTAFKFALGLGGAVGVAAGAISLLGTTGTWASRLRGAAPAAVIAGALTALAVATGWFDQ